MKPVVIGFDTSCYTTSMAVADLEGRIIASSRKLLPVGKGSRGLRQSEMVFHHTRQLPERAAELAELMQDCRVAAVCASSRPRDDEQSYMPAFQVGDAQARTLSALLGVPCFFTTHQRGHLRAALVDSGLEADDYLALHLSGGTTELLAMQHGELRLLGGSLDLHAGQLIDRTGVGMDLPFPAGPSLEQLAMQGTACARLPVSMEREDLCCHLSGAETRLMQWIQQATLSPEDIAAEAFDVLARTVARLLLGGSRATGLKKALLMGGIASSVHFRRLLTERIRKSDRSFQVYFGRPEYSGDNAVGVALLGAEQYRKCQQSQTVGG